MKRNYQPEVIITKEREDSVKEAMGKLRDEFHMDINVLNSVAKNVLKESTIKSDNPLKVAECVRVVLTNYGYSEEEITAYLNRNKRLLLTNYADFKARLGMFAQFGLFEEVFFKYYVMLHRDYNVSTRRLYAGLCLKNPSNLSEFKTYIEDAKEAEIREALKQYPLTQEALIEMNRSLNSLLVQKRRELIVKTKEVN